MHFYVFRNKNLFFERKKHCKDDEQEWNDVIPTEGFGLEHRDHDNGKHGQRDSFLYDFQLDKIEGASVLHGANAVGGNHEGILEQGDAPWHQDDEKERPIFWTGDDFEQFELAIPGKGHEYVGNNEQ